MSDQQISDRIKEINSEHLWKVAELNTAKHQAIEELQAKCSHAASVPKVSWMLCDTCASCGKELE